ncbi:unnamed protein product [Cyprideis torosa]|uniref:Uncharacterized protein n=1 Tax=Cyprideis torosa TaxID=163714 RepID=A0A7R8W0A9_9CRUS|nr:unnamed protein product [Cyprideis torosa]CAG0879550.1 unnamed protein product [Cyprideis torosa]
MVASSPQDPISQPLLVTPDRTLRKDKREMFKLIQVYMMDRKAKTGMTVSTVALDLILKALKKDGLKEELFFTLCKQTTENPDRESLRRGWELMATCLTFLLPPTAFVPYLRWYIEKHRHPDLKNIKDVNKWPTHVQVSHYADVCQQRLERRLNGRRLDSVEPTIRDIDRSRVQIFRPSMFGSTLEEVMRRQKERFPNRRLPWILVTLCHEVLALGGAKTLGIFREAPDHRELDGVYDSLDQWQIPEWTNPLVPATVLKKWLSELYDPLIPTDVQQDLSACPDDIDRIRTILSRLNPLSWLILGYLIRFLQTMCKSDNVENTRMTPYNLAVVFAPNLSPVTSLNPMQVQEDARRANAVIETLIRSLDTSFAEGLA